MQGPALAMIEFKTVAEGILATDALVKKAKVDLIYAHPVTPGKYMVLFGGNVAEVEEARTAGLNAKKDSVIHELFLPQVHPDVLPVLKGQKKIVIDGPIAIIETTTVAGTVLAADIAAKATPIELCEMRLARYLGGKGYVLFTGELADVQASLQAATEYARETGVLAASEIIENPHPEMLEKAVYWKGLHHEIS